MITLDQIKTAVIDKDYPALHDYHRRMRGGETLEFCEADDVKIHMQLNIKIAALSKDAGFDRQMISACDAMMRGAAHPFDDQQHAALTAADAAIAHMQLSPYLDGGK